MLGLRLADLMPANTPTAPTPTRKPATRTKPAPRGPAIFAMAADAVAELERQHRKRSALWTYHNADAEPVGLIVRWNLPNGDKDIGPVSRRAGAVGGWIIGGMPEPRPLYRLPELLARPGERVHITEGEKAADAATALGLLATTSPHGSKSAGKADWTPLAGRDVVILPDADQAGAKYAADVAAILAKLNPPAAVRIVDAGPDGMDLPHRGDIYDWVERCRKAGHAEAVMREDLETLIVQASSSLPADATPTPAVEPPPTIEPANNDAGHRDDDGPAQSQSTLLVKLAEGAELFHTPGTDGEGYATIPVADHREMWRVSCKGFRDATYLDLANERWQAAEMTRDGWRVVDNPPVKFIRPAGLLPLPTPVGGGSVDELRQFVNIGDDADWALILAWLVQALRGRGPFPILVERGSGLDDCREQLIATRI